MSLYMVVGCARRITEPPAAYRPAWPTLWGDAASSHSWSGPLQETPRPEGCYRPSADSARVHAFRWASLHNCAEIGSSVDRVRSTGISTRPRTTACRDGRGLCQPGSPTLSGSCARFERPTPAASMPTPSPRPHGTRRADLVGTVLACEPRLELTVFGHEIGVGTQVVPERDPLTPTGGGLFDDVQVMSSTLHRRSAQ